jgi:hypothetical protein
MLELKPELARGFGARTLVGPCGCTFADGRLTKVDQSPRCLALPSDPQKNSLAAIRAGASLLIMERKSQGFAMPWLGISGDERGTRAERECALFLKAAFHHTDRRWTARFSLSPAAALGARTSVRFRASDLRGRLSAPSPSPRRSPSGKRRIAARPSARLAPHNGRSVGAGRALSLREKPGVRGKDSRKQEDIARLAGGSTSVKRAGKKRTEVRAPDKLKFELQSFAPRRPLVHHLRLHGLCLAAFVS